MTKRKSSLLNPDANNLARADASAALIDRRGEELLEDLDVRRGRWLASLMPPSPFTERQTLGEAPMLSSALDAAAGIATWSELRVEQRWREAGDPRADEAMALRRRRAAAVSGGSPGPAGVDPELWNAFLSAHRPAFEEQGWLDLDDLPQPPPLEPSAAKVIVDRAAATNPHAHERAVAALRLRIREAEEISATLTDLFGETFTLRLDTDMLRAFKLVDGGGRPIDLPRHLAAWILVEGGLSRYEAGLWLFWAGLLPADLFDRAHAKLTAERLVQKVNDSLAFWDKATGRGVPPLMILGNLEWSAWSESKGRELLARFASLPRRAVDAPESPG